MTDLIEITHEHRLTIADYFQTLAKLLTAPGEFFSGLHEQMSIWRPLGFLLASSLFFIGASLTQIQQNYALKAAILFVNAVGMPFVTSVISFCAASMIMAERLRLSKLFTLYAFATGLTLLVSWIPLFVWLTEPWKWLLVAMGLVKGCGLKWSQAMLLIVLSIFFLVVFFWSLAHGITYLKGYL